MTIQRERFHLVVVCNILGWFCQAPLPYPRTDPESVAIRLRAIASVAGLFAHRWPGVGRMLGVPVRASAVLGAGLAPSPSGQRILMSGCMTARRWAKVLAGGFQAIPGWHVVRGGQHLKMRMLLVSFSSECGAPSCILNCASLCCKHI